MTHLLIVLSDGETYCHLEDARVVQVTDSALEEIENDERIKHLKLSDGLLGVRKVQPEGQPVRTWWDSMK